MLEYGGLMPSAGSGLLSLVTTYGPLVIFLIVLIEEAGLPLPIPSDMLLLFSGSLVAQGRLNLGLTLGSVVFATVLGTALLFTLARRGGRPLLRRYGRWIRLDEARFLRAETRLKTHAFWRLTAFRLVPGLRPYSTLTAGILAIPRPQATLAFALSGTIWASVWIGLGILLAPHLSTVVPVIRRAEQALGLGIIALVCIVVLVLFTRSRIVNARQVAERSDQP